MQDLKRVFTHLGPFKKEFILSILFIIAETGFELTIPLIMADIIDVGVQTRDIHYICIKGVQMGICALLSLITGLLYARYAARAALGFGSGVREAEFSRIQSYSFANLDHFSTSSLITRMTTDITIMQNAITGGLRPMVRGPVMLIMGLFLAFWMNAALALVFVICTPVLACILFFIVRRVAPLYGKLQVCMDRVNAAIQENLTAIRAVKAFVREEYEEEVFEKANRELADTSRTTFHFAVLNLPAFQLTMYTSIVLILWFGGGFIQTGSMQVGELTGFLSYVLQIVNSLMMISNVFLMLTRSLASARRINQVFDETSTLSDPENPCHVIPDGQIDFDHVSFKYKKEAKEYTLSDIDLHIKAGETVGIIGGTGSSKSTLVQLIPRLYDATAGSVRVGGRDVRSYSLESLRDGVGIVLQKNVLFSGTIRENLLWGSPGATEDELQAACRAACADEFIRTLPEGLDTRLDQGGVNLSGGQRQRLCIARALLKQPKILIFDDSTSAVDTATESRIREALEAIPSMTKLIIAQRILSVMHADKIVILDDGRIHAVGTHQSLLAESPIYREIYESQKGGR
ncbi:MAG TPA: ABC transporter ATP-binding protein/permease [Candidatus Dorea intestinigallinarum]|nr:ABC transporter ATP-binding protein/permease [Candidatus Dorea intestinigallinarum]